MPEVADQTIPATGQIDPARLNGAQERPYWDMLLSDPRFIIASATVPSREAALDALLHAAKDAAELAPGETIVIAEGWADIDAETPDADDLDLWRKKLDIYHPHYLSLVDSVREALPEMTILSLPLGSTLAEVLAQPALAGIAPGDLFSAETPQGTALLTGTAGAIAQQAASPLPLAPDTLRLPEAAATFSARIAEAVGAVVDDTLLGQPPVQADPDPVSETDAPAVPAPNIPDTPLPVSFVGTDEGDVIVFTQGLEDIQGGGGLDTLVVAALSGNARLQGDDSGALRLSLGDADSAAVTLEGIERIQFEDGTIAFDDDGLAGQAYRLYQACFDRTPDAEGLGFWIKQLDSGAINLQEAARFFLESEEFATVYGEPEALADVHYLALLYANVLDRVPDSDGFGFWRDEQAKGVTRADMLVSFSESAENVALVAAAIDDGIWYV